MGITDPHPLSEQADDLRQTLAPHHRLRMALAGDRIVGFLASNRESVAQLHVQVGQWRRGIGSRLLALAQAESDGHLWLSTFARNAGARCFYEHHGFVAVAHGFEPEWQLDDVRYEWRRPPDPAT